MANLFIRRGRGVPAQTHALRRTRKTILRTVTVNGERQCDAPHPPASIVRRRTGSSSIVTHRTAQAARIYHC